MDANEKETRDILTAIIFNQLALEKNEALIGSKNYKHELKQKVNAVLKYLEPIQKKEYNDVFYVNQEMALGCLFHIEKVVEFLQNYRLEELIFLASMMEAHRTNPKAMEGIINKILYPKSTAK